MNKHFAIIVALLLLGASCNEDDDNNNCIAEAKESCVVTFELNPVCGCDGVTYPNPSTAACNSIEDYTMGACE